MNKLLKTIMVLGFSCMLVTGCGSGVDVEQKITELEVGEKRLIWEEYITLENKNDYKISVDDSDLDINVLGEYLVIYSFENKKNGKVTTTEYTFKVVDTIAPNIQKASEEYIITQGAEYDALSFITISDNYDELTVDDVLVTDEVDINNIGRYNITYTAKDASGNESSMSIKVEVTEKRKELQNNEVILINDLCEFYVESSKIAKEIKPKRPSGVYSYYEAEEGKVIVDICISYKNLTGNDVDSDEVMDATLLYANKYNYDGFCVVEEDNRSDMTRDNDIAPLTTEFIHFLFKVPVELQNSTEELCITLKVGENEYNYFV